MSNLSTYRLKIRKAGFHPLPTEGKVPSMTGWSEKFETSDDEIRLWDSMWHLADNTGILAKFSPGADIDITIEPAAEAVEALAREHFEDRGIVPVRIGQPPKRLIPLRTDEPFSKMVRVLQAPDGSTQKIEILGDGQQYIIAGVHPNTKRPYQWHGGQLGVDVAREDLPYVRREDMERFLDAAAEMLVVEFGFTDQAAAQATTNGDARRERRADSQWGELNERALANLGQWVPKLFPTAKKTKKGGYRVESEDLGRGFEEALSLTPIGIKYFGIADMGDPRQGRRTAIDVVMEWEHLTFIPATEWLLAALSQNEQQQPGADGPADSPWQEGAAGWQRENPGAREQPHTNGAGPPRFNLIPFEQIQISTAPNYLVKGILPRVGLAVVWGPPKCGKSFWLFDLMMHVALGRPYRGRRVQQGPVVYLALEGGHGFRARVEAWRRQNLDGHKDRVPFHLLDVPVDLIKDHPALIHTIKTQLDKQIPVAVTIDTLNRALIGDENDSKDMAKFIRAADAIRAAFGCLVPIVHHCGIAGSRPRGHTSLSGADDVQIAIERDKDGIISATVEHMKDSDAGAVLASKLEKVELGSDDDGDSQSSCVIVATEAGAKLPKLSKAQQFAFDALKKVIASKQDSVEVLAQSALNAKGIPIGTRACLSEVWRKRFYDTYPADKLDTKKKAFLRAALDLNEAGLLELTGEYVWLRRG